MKEEQDKLSEYSEADIITIEGLDHVRKRPGMYIGKLGDGSHSDDGIYVLLKEVLDNSIDEFREGAGKSLDIKIDDKMVEVRDYGRGIPLGKLFDAVSIMNTSGKFFPKKSVGLNGVGVKAVNALSQKFVVQSFRDGKTRRIEFKKGKFVSDSDIIDNFENEKTGTYIEFVPDNELFIDYSFNLEIVETRLRNYSFLNSGLTINFNNKKIFSNNGLLDLLNENITSEPLYPIVHLKGEDIEIALTHSEQYGEEYYSFVNGQQTTQGGTHLSALKESVAKTIKDFYSKNLEYVDIRNGITAAIAINIEEPEFESQTKIKCSSRNMTKESNSVSINKYVNDFLAKELDNYLHRNAETTAVLIQKIQESEKERKAISLVKKNTRKNAAKISLHNKKLRDCRIHFNDAKAEGKAETCIFITEGDSASGSITKTRNPNYQAVFSLRGKPLNSFGENKQIVYKNEEFNLLQSALNIEEGLENLRYNKVIIATDADVDGLHIRLLLMTFFLQFFPDLVKKEHVYILQTPLFRVRNKKETIYCYSEQEKERAIKKLAQNPEITRFKGLGEIDPDEFKNFIGKDMRLEKVTLRKDDSVAEMLRFYMGENSRERQDFIVQNLNVEAE